MELFVTCGSGLEPFAITELQDKFQLKNHNIQGNANWEVFPGKLFFKTEATEALDSGIDDCKTTVAQDAKLVQNLIEGLKTVERIMGVVLVDQASVRVNLTKRDLLSELYGMSIGLESKELFKRWAAIKEIHRNGTRVPAPDTEAEDEVPPEKKPRITNGKGASSVEFRVNVKLTGRFKKVCSPWDVSKSIGSGICKSMVDEKWNINLRNPNLEVSVYLTDNGIIFAVPMTAKPISERSYLTHCPLRSTVAYAMASLVFQNNEDLKTNPVYILDPMCGTGTILVEVARNFSADLICGIDNDAEQVSKCVENVTNANVQNQVVLLQSDSTKDVPLRVEFDAIICDLPFGRQHGTRDGTLADLPKVLKLMNTCLKPYGRAILLISSEMASNLEECVLKNSTDFTLMKKYPVKLGELHAVIFSFKK